MRWYSAFFARHRGLVALFVVVCTALAAVGITRLGFDDVPRGIFANSGGAYARLESVYRDFGADDNDVLVVLQGSDWIAPEGAEVLRDLEARARAVPGVELVAGLADVVAFGDGARPANGLAALVPRPLLPSADAGPADVERAREEARAHPLVSGRMLSDDGRTTLVLARLQRELVDVGSIGKPVEALRAIAADVSRRPGVTALVTGVPAVRVDLYRELPREQVRFLAAGAVLCTLLALLYFRNGRAVLATVAGPVLGGVWSLGACGLLGQEIDILSAVLPELAIVIGFTDSVHLMIEARAARARGDAPLAAAADAIRHLGQPCLLTSITTGVGFASLAWADVPMIRRFGLLAAVAVTVTFLAVLTTLPLLVSALPGIGAVRPAAVQGRGWAGWVERTVAAVVAHSRAVALGGLALTAAFFAIATRLEPENRLTEALPRGGDAYRGLEAAEHAFGGVLPAYVLVEWDPAGPVPWDAMAAVEERVRALPGAHAPLSPRDLAALVPGGAADPAAALRLEPAVPRDRLWRPDRGRALISFRVADGGRELTQGIFGRLEGELATLSARFPAVGLHLTGTDVVARAEVDRMIVELAQSLALAAVVIFGAIALEFRSLGLGLASIPPNLFPLAFVAAGLVLTGRPLQMASAVLFTILLGLAVDDTIHFLARYRREGGWRSGDAGLVRTAGAVGEAIGFTTWILVAGFGVVVLSPIPTNRLFAVATAIGLCVALLGDLLLLPALLARRARFLGRRSE